MIETIDFEPTFEKIENRAKADGAEAELLIERSEKFATSFQKGKPEKFDSSLNQVAGLRVILNGFEGYAYSENLSDEALAQAYAEALSNAKFTALGADPSAKVELFSDSKKIEEDPALFNDSLASVSVEEKLDRARTLEATAVGFDTRITAIPYSGYSESESEFQIYNSRGLRRRQRQTGVFGYVYCLAKQGEESRMSGESKFTRIGTGFQTKHLAEEAAKKALAKLGAIVPDTGQYPVVIDAEVAAEFIGLLSGDFSAKTLFQKTSLFQDKLGQSIASENLTIVDDPFFKDGLATRRFDSEGAASQTTPLIEKGVLKNVLTNSVYARRMNLPHTSNAERGARSELEIGPSNLMIQKGTKSLEELLASYPRVIYITDFAGYHAGYQDGSGDFSLQSEGELWENGKRVGPLNGFVTSGNILEVLKNIEAVSSRVLPPTSSVIAPDLLIKSLSIAGK